MEYIFKTPAKRSWLRALYCIPAIVGGYVTVLAMRPLAGGPLCWFAPFVLCCRVERGSWFGKRIERWAGISVGYGILLKSDVSNWTVYHEERHVEQVEVGCLTGLGVGLIAGLLGWSWWALLACWFMTPLLMFKLSWVNAIVRGEGWYRGSVFEEHAYSETAEAERESHS